MSRKLILSQVYLNIESDAGSQWKPIEINGTPPENSLALSFTSDSINVKNQDNISFQINSSSDSDEGTFYVQISDDNVNWVDMGVAGVLIGQPDVILCEVGTGARMYVRIRWESTVAGTGTAQIIATAKNLGA